MSEKENAEKEKLRKDVKYPVAEQVLNGGYGWVVAFGAALGNVRFSLSSFLTI